MTSSEDAILRLLGEIKALLEPISANHRMQFLREQERLLKGMITPVSRRVIPLLFDPRRLTQARIAKLAEVSQPTVSRIVADLKKRGLITEEKDSNFNSKYVDRFNLVQLIEAYDEERN